ncbi:hypothetical protein B0H17DRAFT_1130723 [Mycena rosella]|uniref:Uncharacterized protein n=1 Tax=Mycena rosella TaxID=1033263 RepID=A0AAD7DQ26_MYCRO|nr:hypothetical protein B0H17DRAFT_1130723 [Mycena rosella]
MNKMAGLRPCQWAIPHDIFGVCNDVSAVGIVYTAIRREASPRRRLGIADRTAQRELIRSRGAGAHRVGEGHETPYPLSFPDNAADARAGTGLPVPEAVDEEKAVGLADEARMATTLCTKCLAVFAESTVGWNPVATWDRVDPNAIKLARPWSVRRQDRSGGGT